MKRGWLAVVVCVLGVVTACRGVSSDPPNDCSYLVGYHFIVMQPPTSGVIYDYTINVGDSIRLIGTVHRADAATATFDPLGGWSCATTASSQVPGVVTFTTNDTQLVRLHANGWVRGLTFGSATVVAASTSPAATDDIDILVYTP